MYVRRMGLRTIIIYAFVVPCHREIKINYKLCVPLSPILPIFKLHKKYRENKLFRCCDPLK
uniref:Uncharacterized protein n=1 Tax=Lepeophtheirus salmonis TaxID=72036 RepID=A0A0K2VDC0_LEPSM